MTSTGLESVGVADPQGWRGERHGRCQAQQAQTIPIGFRSSLRGVWQGGLEHRGGRPHPGYVNADRQSRGLHHGERRPTGAGGDRPAHEALAAAKAKGNHVGRRDSQDLAVGRRIPRLPKAGRVYRAIADLLNVDIVPLTGGGQCGSRTQCGSSRNGHHKRRCVGDCRHDPVRPSLATMSRRLPLWTPSVEVI